MISFGSFFIPHSLVEGILVFPGFQLHLWPEVLPWHRWILSRSSPGASCTLTSGQLCSLHCEPCQSSGAWKVTLISLFWWLHVLWFQIWLVSLCLPCLWHLNLGVGAAPKRSPSTGKIFDWNIMRTEEAGVVPDSSICCMKCESLPEEVPFQLLTMVLPCNYSFGWKIPAF